MERSAGRMTNDIPGKVVNSVCGGEVAVAGKVRLFVFVRVVGGFFVGLLLFFPFLDYFVAVNTVFVFEGLAVADDLVYFLLHMIDSIEDGVRQVDVVK